MKCKEYLCTSGILFGFKKAYGTELCIEIMLDYARDLRYQYIHAPLVKRVYAECSPLFQLIKLINSLKNNSNDTILEIIAKKSHSYNGFAFNVTRSFLDTYDPICRIEKCYVCQLQ